MSAVEYAVPREPIPVEGMEIAPGIWGLGDARWHEDAQQWRCLANVNGALCLIEVVPRASPSVQGKGRQVL